MSEIQTENSTSTDDQSFSHSEDPLLDFLERRKKQRHQFEGQYSKKALVLRAYLKQKEILDGPECHSGILLSVNL